MDATRTRTTRTETLAVLALALVLRLWVVWIVLTKYPAGWLFTRGREMGLLANSLLAGEGLGSPFGVPTGPTAFIAPGYPLFVAGIFRLFGSDSFTSALVILLLQVAVNLVTIAIVMHVARSLFDQRTAIIAGFIWACSIPVVWIPTIFWDTSIATCLLMGLIALALHFRGRMTPRLWCGLGLYCAIVGLINPAMLLILAAIGIWMIWQQRPRSLGGPLLAVVVFAVAFSPWPIRNALVFHAFIPLRTTVGFEMWMGNRPGAKGFLDESLFPTFNPQELSDYKSMGEIAYTNHKSQLAKEFILAHPATFIRLTTVRIARYWLGRGSQGGSIFFTLHATTTSFFGLMGLGMLIRRRSYAVASLFALPLLLFPIPYYITHAEIRYRLELDALLTLLASYAIVTLCTKPVVEPAQPLGKVQAVHV